MIKKGIFLDSITPTCRTFRIYVMEFDDKLAEFDVTVICHDVMLGFIKCSNHYLLAHSSQHPGDHYLPTLQPAGVIPRREKGRGNA